MKIFAKKNYSNIREPLNLNKLAEGMSESEWRDMYIEHAKGERNDILPFPSDDIQVITNNHKGEATGRGALAILDCVLSCVRETTTITKSMKILDYGCGWGRVTRLLPYYFNAESITGVDVNKRLIDDANKLVPEIEHVKIKSMARLPFKDGSYDIIFANSVFSHLSKKACLFTLEELSRLLSKDGVLIVSILELAEMNKFYGNETQRKWISKILGEESYAKEQLDREGFIWGDTKRWHEYGITIMTDDWIAKTLQNLDMNYRSTKRTVKKGSQNYKVAIKV